MHRWLIPTAAAFALVFTVGVVFLALKPNNEVGTSGYQVRHWSIQLQGIKPELIESRNDDLTVIDYSADGHAETIFTSADLARIKTRPDGGQKLVLAYLSIGESESYRHYWDPVWSIRRPDWMGAENPRWPGNFSVDYWTREWRSVLYGDPDAYLDRILAAGFDGVYLDTISEFTRAEGKDRPRAAKAMIDLIVDLAAYARERRPNFLVIAQNPGSLARSERMRSVIDAIAQEDLLYGVDGDGKENSENYFKRVSASLNVAYQAGLPILVVEYLPVGEKRMEAAKRLGQLGYVATFATRKLDQPSDSDPVSAQVSFGIRAANAPR
ncbi:endo alpha-1,4 polygalactosaminidase [Hoeflea sp. G2-23]|uniref:Endo alpha-1,4 polygalactosaminidase n=1 Tax=Hoeflea algicola TaxID=2983763 RepID=A0ABT3ZCE6_9HYPH|nr:MJ1477/TM1410 family putative glycoside hydrolase [Hoeflea algicola]MCY0149393.1 endo alpha-1,4 polygalactosaminidase [Hoeflea algicola]